MKKLILTALLSLFICVVFAQEQQVVVPDTAQVTLTRVYNDVTQGIQGLAQALKAPAEKVWEVLVVQQKVNAIAYTILLIVGLIICIVLVFIIKWLWKNTDDGEDGAIFMTIVTIILIIAEIICIIVFTPDIITGFVNPEYGAIKEILNVIS
jgi:hypothetical protein